MAKRHVTEEQKVLIAKGAREGKAPVDIARELHLLPGAVNYWFYKEKKAIEKEIRTKSDPKLQRELRIQQHEQAKQAEIPATVNLNKIAIKDSSAGEFTLNGTVENVDELVLQISSVLYLLQYKENLQYEISLIWGR